MKFSYNSMLSNQKRIKRRKNNKKKFGGRCYHCNGAFRGSEDFETCLMCGREKGHICDNCMFSSKANHEEKLA